MPESARIARQMLQAFDADAWHGDSVSQVIASVTATVANARPIAQAHTIGEIVLHLIATQRILLRRLDGDATAKDMAPEEDWPTMADPSEVAWQAAVAELTSNDRSFRERVAAFPEDRLDLPLIPGGSSAYNNFHGYVQHNLYHLGQIALLSKAHGV